MDGAWFYSWVSFPVIIRLLAHSQSWDCWLYKRGFGCQFEWEPWLTCSSLFLIFWTLSRPKIQWLLFWNLLKVQNKAVDLLSETKLKNKAYLWKGLWMHGQRLRKYIHILFRFLLRQVYNYNPNISRNTMIVVRSCKDSRIFRESGYLR